MSEPLTYEQAWKNISGGVDEVLCDACRKPIVRDDLPDGRPLQIVELAERGIINLICSACAPISMGSRGRIANLVEACVARSQVPK